jgi:hypothetical protein
VVWGYVIHLNVVSFFLQTTTRNTKLQTHSPCFLIDKKECFFIFLKKYVRKILRTPGQISLGKKYKNAYNFLGRKHIRKIYNMAKGDF